tara:strand:+ start:2095 stop:2280 length:186 start_codon:yes stop_codon:yes gene_type:complete
MTKEEVIHLSLTPKQLFFLEDVLELMLEGYKKESKDFEDEEYYAEEEMKLTKEILNKIDQP